MKKLLPLILASLLMAVTVSVASADEFPHGTTEEGYYCFDAKDENGECDLIYSKDASLIGEKNNAKSFYEKSSVWYITRLIHKKQYGADSTYQNRINAMKVLLAK